MREMKDSGVEWLGDIPETWELVQLGSLFSEHKKKNTGMQSNNLLSLSYGKIIRKDINTSDGLLPESFEGYNVIDEGDIVLRLTDLQNDQRSLRVGLSPEKGIVTSAYVTLRKRNSAMNSHFFYYLIHSYDMRKGFYGMGAGVRQGLNFAGVRKIMLPLPPVEVQNAIASLLKEELDKVDALISNNHAQIEKLKAYKQSLITEVVTKGLDPTVKMKDSGVEWLGQVPEHWGVHRIANLYEERSENGLPELPILTVSINTGVSDHEIADKEKDRVFIRMEDRTKYKRVYPGDLTYNMMRAWQGAFGAVRVDGLVSPAYVVAKPKKTIPLDSRYIEALLRTPVAIEEMHRYSRGIIDFRLRLYWPEFKNIRICLPSIEEQCKIADYIDEITSKVDALIAVKQSKIEKLEQYKKSLIYEYVTGKREVS